MYDFMEGYVLLVPDWSPVDAAPIDFRLKDITRLLQQPNAKPKNGAGRESPTSRPSTPLQKKAKGHKHSASAVSQSGLSMSDRKGLLSRAQLAYIVLDGPEGWLRFYTDSSKSEVCFFLFILDLTYSRHTRKFGSSIFAIWRWIYVRLKDNQCDVFIGDFQFASLPSFCPRQCRKAMKVLNWRLIIFWFRQVLKKNIGTLL